MKLPSSFKLMLSVILASLLVILSIGEVSAQRSVPDEKIKEAFFTELTRPQIVSLLESIDRGKQLTSFELGAKYRWGYIPADRRPPVGLAQWWRSLSPRQKNQQRVEWFRKHYRQLNLNRAARELGLEDRLTEVYRRLREELNRDPGNLESVPFPGESPVKTASSDTDPGFQAIYQQKPDSVPDEGDPGPTVPETDTKDRKTDDTTNNHVREENSKSSGPSPASEKEGQKSVRNESDTVASDTMTFDSGSIIYRRVGDHIEIIRKQPTGLDAGESPEIDSPKSGSSDLESTRSLKGKQTPSSATLNRRNSLPSPRLSIPDPNLRSLSNDNPRLRR